MPNGNGQKLNGIGLNNVLQVVQLIVLLGAAAGLAMTFGGDRKQLKANTDDIHKLTGVAEKLAEGAASRQATDADHDRRLDRIEKFIDRLGSQ